MLRSLLGKDSSDIKKPPTETKAPDTKSTAITVSPPANPAPMLPVFKKENNKLLNLKVKSGLGDNSIVYKNVVELSSKHKLDSTSRHVVKMCHENRTLYYPVMFEDELKKQVPELKETIADENIYLHRKMKLGINLDPDQNLEKVELFKISNDSKPQQINKIEIEVEIYTEKSGVLTMRHEDLQDACHKALKDYLVMPKQYLYVRNPIDPSSPLVIYIKSINDIKELKTNSATIDTFALNARSNLVFNVAPDCPKLKLLNAKPKFTLNFAEKGIGGHKTQLEKLLRSAFYSRTLSPEYVTAYGIKHNKGILLYGPPGTGKTLIAREIGKMFSKDKVKVINGSEVKNKFYGQSQQNLRDAFNDAIKEYKQKGDNSDLHVIIIDEIDSIAEERTTSSSAGGANNDLVTALLTMLDGVDSPQNILVIGMTNRKDLIDEALLRPGRLSTHIYIGLPDEDARLEILQIKTKLMKENNLLADDVDLKHWAKVTENYSGAELEELVKRASQFAIVSNFDPESDRLELKKDIHSKDQLAKVSQSHFQKAFKDIVPKFGINKENFNFDRNKFVNCSPEISATLENFDSCVEMLRKVRTQQHLNFLISGDRGVGKSDLAKLLALRSGAKYIKVISADKLLSIPLQQQLTYLDKEFANAQNTELSVIILEDVEKLLQADARLFNYNNLVRLKLESLLKSVSESPTKAIVIATTRSEDFITSMGLDGLFQESSQLKNIVLNYRSVIDCGILTAIAASRGYEVVRDEKQETSFTGRIDLPISQLIYKMDRYCVDVSHGNSINLESFFKYTNNEMKHTATIKSAAKTASGIFKPSLAPLDVISSTLVAKHTP